MKFIRDSLRFDVYNFMAFKLLRKLLKSSNKAIRYLTYNICYSEYIYPKYTIGEKIKNEEIQSNQQQIERRD